MNIKEYFKKMVEMNASDMFCRVGSDVRMRVDGQVIGIGKGSLSEDDLKQALDEILTDEQKSFFQKNLDVDFALFLPELSRRFRVSVFQQQNWPSIVVRSISPIIQTMEELNLPASVL